MDMEVREPRCVEEYRAGERIIAAAWQAAFDEIVSDAALERVEGIDADPRVSERYQQLQDAPDAIALIARTDDAVVGTASVSWGDERTKRFTEPDDAELITLYAHPDRWGDGIGTTLLSTVIDALPAHTERLVLQTFTENERGRTFYEARDFEVVDTWTFEVAGDTYPTVVYAREL